jgi:hypothetical protein
MSITRLLKESEKMADIKIFELSTSGSELLTDSESFLDEMAIDSSANTYGGWVRPVAVSMVAIYSFVEAWRAYNGPAKTNPAPNSK